MATNNLLVNNEQKVLYDQVSKIERSGHNLSQSRKFPCRVGYIYPFFCRKTIPSDSFKIWSNILVKQLQPLLVPQMVSFTVNTAFYWVDYLLAFPEFEYFLINQRGKQNVELPYISESDTKPFLSAIDNADLGTNLRPFLDFTRKEVDGEKIDALPFWAYHTIIRDFYTNIDRLSEDEYNSYFPDKASDWNLKPGVNTKIGKDINPFKLAVHNVRGDYFVNSYPTPIRGDVPTLSQDLSIDSFMAEIDKEDKELADTFNNNLYLSRPSDQSNISPKYAFSSNFTTPPTHYLADASSYPLKTPQDGISPNAAPAGESKSVGFFANASYNFKKINELITNPITFKNIQGLQYDVSITSRQLRLLESLTRKREIDILMKPRLKNYLNTYFGVERYKDDSLYQPVFIGSTTQTILINDIEQTTATQDSPLGRQGATAISLGNNYVGEFYSRSYGCLIGLMYILPDYDYEPAIPKEWQERTPDDFVNPEFTHLSMQPILNKEMYFSDDKEWNNEVLGYMGMYDNYRTSVNLVSGEFLNEDMQDVRQFAQVRRFEDNNKPEITTSFLNSNTAFDSSVFSVPTLPPFIAQCVARVEAVRPIPQLAIPRG